MGLLPPCLICLPRTLCHFFGVYRFCPPGETPAEAPGDGTQSKKIFRKFLYVNLTQQAYLVGHDVLNQSTFQSSPSPKAGRFVLRVCAYMYLFKFQSSPSPKAGRFRRGIADKIRHAFVSILAQPEGRALPMKEAALKDPIDVSILAQPEGRALLHGAGWCPGRHCVSILAQPEGRALRAQGLRLHVPV